MMPLFIASSADMLSVVVLTVPTAVSVVPSAKTCCANACEVCITANIAMIETAQRCAWHDNLMTVPLEKLVAVMPLKIGSVALRIEATRA
ncbi:hypothetical protein APY04_1655 [Hyphomicrobium sulfonivorans]|uniref:Uncharacterized protein n=1 Tax=Hyphomicrobium sulfonivorans TaxID=121290 RepID=A0A109BHQ7_HYPSL|nr:hypothetical protein APY04_1655 [Hyphomicrobium sulfonivorans]